MTIPSIIAAFLLIIGIACCFGLSPTQITSDVMELISPKDSIRTRARNVRRGRGADKTYRALLDLQNALKTMGKGGQFAFVMTSALLLMAAGIILSMMLENLFILPVLAIAGVMVPFVYASNLVTQYKKRVQEELETALSIISLSYCRTDDIVGAVRDNVDNIRPPLQEIFHEFVVDATAVDSNIKRALFRLKDKIANDIFNEWCDTAIRCQDDRLLKDTLMPIVNKFTDVRLVNEELATMIAETKVEYWSMVMMVVAVIPILYFLNKDWYNTLMDTTVGKIMLTICAITIMVTYLFLRRFTKPIEYKR